MVAIRNFAIVQRADNIYSFANGAYGYTINTKTGEVHVIPEMPLIEKAIADHIAAVEFLRTIEDVKGAEMLRAQVTKQAVSSAKVLMRETSEIKPL